MKFCGAFELALRGHVETDSSVNPGIFRGLMDLVSSLHTVLEEHLKTATTPTCSRRPISTMRPTCSMRPTCTRGPTSTR
ncbi:hypothetical protein F7725_017528 [Dissostichus mawsoni]|uniref:Uncharacterized protein n=1 Tax=Dissostichus mawsoni TaxID=36200 RepID=A0A7J5Z4P0_DISMA|nr:hypothetical protein F7725_017528 [Dissostichus mawsoni]